MRLSARQYEKLTGKRLKPDPSLLRIAELEQTLAEIAARPPVIQRVPERIVETKIVAPDQTPVIERLDRLDAVVAGLASPKQWAFDIVRGSNGALQKIDAKPALDKPQPYRAVARDNIAARIERIDRAVRDHAAGKAWSLQVTRDRSGAIASVIAS